MSNRNQGFTLIELIVTLTILGIAVAIAVAAFGEVIERNRQEALKDEIENALYTARTQAILQRRTIEICGSGNGKSCSSSWTDGWLIRAPSGQILKHTQLPAHTLRWRGSALTCASVTTAPAPQAMDASSNATNSKLPGSSFSIDKVGYEPGRPQKTPATRICVDD